MQGMSLSTLAHVIRQNMDFAVQLSVYWVEALASDTERSRGAAVEVGHDLNSEFGGERLETRSRRFCMTVSPTV